MKNYVKLSLETNLFFARIMKEHALFLQAGFVTKNQGWIRRADSFRRQFENLLAQTVQISNHMIGGHVLQSDEFVTEFTFAAERKTSELSGIPIDSRITRAEQNLDCGKSFEISSQMVQTVQRINERAVWLLNEMIPFQEQLLESVRECNTFTANYPLLIEHINGEARLYRETLQTLMREPRDCQNKMMCQEVFWDGTMMEHALFIRGLLDPSEEELICTANDFAQDFRRLLEQARRQDFRVCENRMNDCDNTLTTTIQLRDFKAAGTEGILKCQIQSIILPLLADHVLREANHYIRILEHNFQ